MPIPVVVPRLGWTMEQGVFVEWLKRDGDTIQIGDPIFVLEGEKATQDIESTDAGVLKILSTGPRPGDTIDVGATVGYLLAEGEAWDGTASATPVPPAANPTAAEEPATELDEDEPVVESNAGAGTSRQRITPRARRAADELGVDWTEIDGTGAGGRIRESDVRAASEGSIAPLKASTPAALPPVELSAVAASNARRTIAERMLASAQQTAAVTLTTHVDATHLVALRKQFKAAAGDPSEVIPSLTDILVKLTAVALKMHPEVNSRWDDERILTSDEAHIGIAVDTPQALLVPVLRSVTRLTLRQVAVRSRDLIERARTRKIAVADLQGGTFTVTNLGMFGIDAFTPLLNPPQAAILGVGRITREAAVIDEHIVPRDRLTLSLTFDHRIIDVLSGRAVPGFVIKIDRQSGPRVNCVICNIETCPQAGPSGILAKWRGEMGHLPGGVHFCIGGLETDPWAQHRPRMSLAQKRKTVTISLWNRVYVPDIGKSAESQLSDLSSS